jgi:phosphate transport system protein
MRQAYDEQLAEVTDGLVQLADAVAVAMNRATTSLLDADLDMAESVIAGDAVIDSLAQDLEERMFELTVRQQPVASDLRSLVAALRISASLERMGDLAVHIAKAARLRYPNQTLPPELRNTIIQMGQIAQEIVNRAGQVIRTRNVVAARELQAVDERMDRLHRDLFGVMLARDWPHGVEAAIDITLIARYYERFADHATTIARRVIQVVTGEAYIDIPKP